MFPRRFPWYLPFFVSLFIAAQLHGSPGAITITQDPPGAVRVGEAFLLTFRMFGYSGSAEIDAVRFRVLYPDALFTFVDGSFNVAGVLGDVPWLARPNQESPGFVLTSSSDGSTAGRVDVHLRDTGQAAAERGTMAPEGFLISFRLRAHHADTGLIRIEAYQGSSGPETLYDTTGVPSGVPAFNAAFKTVNPGQSLAIVLAGTNAIVSWPVEPAGFVLQQKSVLSPLQQWSDVSAEIIVSGNRREARLPATGPMRFFRLRSGP